MKKSLRNKNVVSLLVLLSVTGCGRNAFIQAKKVNSILDSRAETAKPTNPIKDGVSTKGRILGKDINLGTIQIPVSMNLPLYLNNLSKDIQSVSLSSSDTQIEILQSDITEVAASKTIHNDILKVTPTGVGPFLYQVKIKYSIGGKEKVSMVEVSGVATEVNISHNAKLELYRKDATTVQHGEIPAGSTSNVETVLKNPGLNTAVVTAIELLDQDNFKLEDHSDSCLGVVIENCILKTAYTPKSEGSHNSHVRISYTDGKGISNSVLMPISGMATSQVACVETNEVAKFALTQDQLTMQQLEGTMLPYKEQVEDSSIILDAIYGDAYNKQESYLEAEYNYVEDAQVISLTDLKDVKKKGRVVDVKMYTKLVKSYLDREGSRFLKTELLCLENVLSCSGNKFFSGGFVKHNKEDYSVDSEYFSSEILKNSKQVKLSDGGLYIFERTLDLTKAFPTKKDELFTSIRKTSKVKAIFADDIKLDSSPLLKVKYKKIKDKSNKCD